MPVNFKNEEEVKEYLENLGIEYRFGCFSEKKPEVCHLLGHYLDAVKKDFQKAAKIYKSNCDDDNYPRSCHTYGQCLLSGQGVEKKNVEGALQYFMKACSLGFAISCYNAGVLEIMPFQNLKRERDYTKGIPLLEKGCDLKHAGSCYILSGLYIAGNPDEKIEKDMRKAFQFAEKACDLNHLYACYNLSLMYTKGEGVEKNDEMAKKYKLKAEELKEELKSSALSFQRGTTEDP